jgi:hypothetical protein
MARASGMRQKPQEEIVEEAVCRLFEGSSTDRPWLLLEIMGEIEPNRADAGAIFWKIVAREWCGFDRIPHARFELMFRSNRRAWSPSCMEDADRAAFDALPQEPFRIWRGQDGRRSLGLAWTRNLDVAEGFARGHRSIRNKRPSIASVLVRPCDAALVQTDRSEAEIVLFRRPRLAAVRWWGPDE